MKLRTVAINRDGTKVLINRSSFIEGRHVLWEQEKPEPVSIEGVEIRETGRGWYDVYADGQQINEKRLRQADAEALADQHR